MVTRPSQSPLLHNNEYSIAATIFVAAGIIATVWPGVIVGGALAWVVWRVSRPPIVVAWLLGLLGAATAATLRSSLLLAWPWRLLLHAIEPDRITAFPIPAVVHSMQVEPLLGPLVLVAVQFGVVHGRQTIQGQEWARTRDMAARKKALEHGWPGPNAAGDVPAATDVPGQIRLGIVAEDQRPFDLAIEELSQHVFLPGASGSGKTTTIAAIANGALANGYGVVIVDCKGSGLGGVARSLAARHAVPFTIVDPRDPKSIGYWVISAA